MGSKKLQVWLPILFSITMVLGMLIGYQLKERTGGNRFFNLSGKTSLQEVVELIKGKYVDKIAADSINQLAVSQLLSHLDPHSSLIPKEDLSENNEQLMGNFQGIGVEFQLFNDTVNVMSVIKGGPSEKAGILVGDKLITVNDSLSITGKNAGPERIRKLLKGEKGSKVKVDLMRNGKKLTFNLERGVIPVPSVDVAYMLDAQTGFLKINRFADRTYEEFMENMGRLQKLGMKQLILDLRGNGGGLMKEATAIADEFLSDDKLIVYTEGEKVNRTDFRAQRDGIFEKGKLIVLIDETSASASEVLCGALQDWDRATIVGRRSFGKGLVQTQFQLSDGSAVRLTVARYYSPLGRNIQKPYGKDKDAYNEELLDRYHNGSLLKADTMTPKGKAFKTPGGRLVYGGGGITPDVFVPLDTSKINTALLKLYYRNSLNNFVYHYYIQYRPKFDGFQKPLDLVKGFQPGKSELDALRSFAFSSDSIKISSFNPKEAEQVSQRLQILMARQIWRTEGYFELANQFDPTVQKGIALLK
jgi:carboxyl-terminal processing protease